MSYGKNWERIIDAVDKQASTGPARGVIIGREITTVAGLREALLAFTDEAELLRSVTVTYHLDLEHGSKIRIRED